MAYNVNLNTTSTRRANAIAFDIREAGRLLRENNNPGGALLKDENGEPIRKNGLFKHVKGIGWYIEEYGVAQISYNLTNINVSPLHEVFDKTCERAQARGLRVTGSELVGLVPKNVLIQAGIHFLKKQQRSIGISEKEIMKIAIKSLGLDELAPFILEERVIEYMLDDIHAKRLVSMNLIDFANETSSESPAPGGGSISAYCGAMGAALGTMVANLSAHKRGWDDRWEEFSNWAEKGIGYQNELLALVDEDTKAFNQIMDAYRLPKETKEQKSKRDQAIQEATKLAITTPFKVMEVACNSMQVMKAMAEIGNPNSVTDTAVGALCARTAVRGAFLNVQINCGDCTDKDFVSELTQQGEELIKKATDLENEIMKITEAKI